jgi:serine/threonine protein kinase
METRFVEVRKLFDAAITLPAEDRQAFLNNCGQSAEIIEEVQELIQALDAHETELLDRAPIRPDYFELSPGERLGPYRIEALLGRGGMGAVYKASRVDQFEKQVAIKVVTTGIGLDAFRRERQILAVLEHPNIARLLDGGETIRTLPYLVMEYVEGKPLTHPDAIRGLGIRERLQRFLAVCEGVQYLHENRIIHRDLKPANILVSEAGAVKILDFGVSKFVHGLKGGATTGPLGMTPKYASPEQILQKPVAPSSDVYSLGVMLFELVTNGAYPYPTTSEAVAHEFLEAALKAEPRRPSEVNRDIASDLDSIVLKAIARDPADRYPSTAELRDDIRRFLGGKPVRAHNGGRFYRAKKRFMEHRAAFTAVALVSLAFLGIAGYAVSVSRRASNQVVSARRISPDDGFEYRTGAISPDGRYLAYVSNRTSWRQLWLQEMRGTDSSTTPVQLTNATGHVSSPRFLPGESKIGYFVLDNDGKGTIETIPIAGGSAPSVVHVIDSHAFLPQISPDGKLAMYLRGKGFTGAAGESELCVVPMAGGECRFLPEFTRLRRMTDVIDLTWNGDSKRILYRLIERTAKTPAIWAIPLDGSPAEATPLAEELRSKGVQARPAMMRGDRMLLHWFENIWSARVDPRTWKLKGAVTQLFSGTEEVLPLSISNTGVVLVAATRHWNQMELVEAGRPGRAAIVPVGDQQRLQSMHAGGETSSAYFSSLAPGLKESTVRAVNLRTLAKSVFVPDLPSDWRMIVSHDGRKVAYNVPEQGRNSIRLGDAGTSARASKVVCQDSPLCGYATSFSADSQSLWLIQDRVLTSVDLEFKRRRVLLHHTRTISSASPFGSDGKWIALRNAIRQTNPGKVYLYRLPTDNPERMGVEVSLPSDEIAWESNGLPVFYCRTGTQFYSAGIDSTTGRVLAPTAFQVRDSQDELVAGDTIKWEPRGGSILLLLSKTRRTLWATTLRD